MMISFEEDPHKSTRQVALEHNVSHVSVWKLLKSQKWHPYKIHLVQELNEDDFDRRNEFCETLNGMIDQNPHFEQCIIFSDEATFSLNGTVNRHNCRYWSRNNPRWMVEAHTQHRQKVNVWAGIVGNKKIGPFFIDGNLNSEKYLQLLHDDALPAFRQLFPGSLQENIWFQQDGAPAHYGRRVIDFLNQEFIGRWIGRRGHIEWPARSPDLNPLDFFMWGYLKSRVYCDRPNTIEDLKLRIRNEMELITPETVRNAIHCFRDRLGHCLAVNGSHFEHLL